MPRIPLIEDLLTGPIPVGSTLLVEFDPASQWYAASATMAAGWLRKGGRVDYSVLTQRPDKIRAQLRRLGTNPEELEEAEKLGIYDWYTPSLGQKSKEKYGFDSLKVADLSIRFSRYEMGKSARPDLVAFTDDLSCLGRFNDDKSWVEFVLTRYIPYTSSRQGVGIRGVAKGVLSEWVYKRLEASVEGVIDFKLEEAGEETRDLIRIRSMREVAFDRQWHQLKVGENFEVTLDK